MSRSGPDDEPHGSDAEVLTEAPEDAASARRADEPPVVARLVVEIRSDGSRTIARGALEDRIEGQSVAIEARGSSPLSLALSLARAMTQAPSLARRTARRLLPGRRRRKPPGGA